MQLAGLLLPSDPQFPKSQLKFLTRTLCCHCCCCCCRDYLEEAGLELLPEGVPSYLTAAVGPPRIAAPRKFCSVCGDMSAYTCTRCGSRYCSRRCHAVHTETRCLKFIA
jgi:hypothetical protein